MSNTILDNIIDFWENPKRSKSFSTAINKTRTDGQKTVFAKNNVQLSSRLLSQEGL